MTAAPNWCILQMPEMWQCPEWHAMCEDEPGFYLCKGGSSGGKGFSLGPVMKMWVWEVLGGLCACPAHCCIAGLQDHEALHHMGVVPIILLVVVISWSPSAPAAGTSTRTCPSTCCSGSE